MNSKLIQDAAAEAGMNQKTIEGRTYGLKLMPAMKGLIMGKRLIQTFAPALGVLLDSNPQEDDLFGDEQNLFTDIAIALVAQSEKLDVEQTVKDLLGGLTCDGHDVPFNTHFQGKYQVLMELVGWSLKENFGDFFTVWLKEKGLSIHTLKSMMLAQIAEENSEQSSD